MIIIAQLCQALLSENINYCHWKSNAAIERSALGENDLDLLVSRDHAQKFTEILFRLGFREAQARLDKKLPGILDYYGYAKENNELIHIHVHYQLIVGNDLSKNYRIPIEKPYLDSAIQQNLFRIPAPGFELVVFVLRMALKHITWDSILMGQGGLSQSEQNELDYLATPENLDKVGRILEEHLPYLDQSLFNACLQSIKTGSSITKRIQTGERLQKALSSCARYPQFADIYLKLLRRTWQIFQWRILKNNPKRSMTNGGLFVAIVGGDGSGKSTAIDGLFAWLSKKFEIKRYHMGKPEWSLVTFLLRGFLKVGTMAGLYSFNEDLYCNNGKFPGYPWLIRTVCTARDRYLTYLKARRFSSNGGIVICDRYPIRGLAMDAPQCSRVTKTFNIFSRFLTCLSELENNYYKQIAMPDLLIVLKISPDIAVKRKVDESEVSVHARSTLVWEFDWSKIPAYIIDASLPKDKVLDEIKSIVWEYL